MEIVGWLNAVVAAVPAAILVLVGVLAAAAGARTGAVVPSGAVIVAVSAALETLPERLFLFVLASIGASIALRLRADVGGRRSRSRSGANGIVLGCTAVSVVLGFLLRASLPGLQDGFGDLGWAVLGVALIWAAGTAIVARVRGPRSGIPGVPDAELRSGPSEGTLRERLFHQDVWRTLPNLITLLRLLLLPVFTVLLVQGAARAATVTIAIVFLTDFLDGFLARTTHTTSALGAWLEPVADRFTVVVVAISIVLAGYVPLALLVLLLIPDVLLAGAAVVIFRGSPGTVTTWTGKLRTVALFLGLMALLIGAAIGGRGSVERVLLETGLALFLLGVAGHYAAGVQYMRAMTVIGRMRARRP